MSKTKSLYFLNESTCLSLFATASNILWCLVDIEFSSVTLMYIPSSHALLFPPPPPPPFFFAIFSFVLHSTLLTFFPRTQVDRIQPLSRAAIKAGTHARATAGSYLARKLRQRMRQDRRRTSIITTQTTPTIPASRALGESAGQGNPDHTQPDSVFTTRKTET